MEIQEHLPLSESSFFIILSLADGAKHGYAIMKEVERLSAGRTVLSTGTLYGALKRMLEGGWIERVDEADEEEGNGRTRKGYRLTRLGRRILEAETSRLRGLLRAAEMRTEGRAA